MLQPAPKSVLRIPRVVAWGLQRLPLLPLETALQHLLAGIVERHPAMIERLEEMGRRHIAIDPSDVPFVFLLEVGGGNITLRVVRELRNSGVHTRICGPLLALIGLVDGTYDGDALFFSRDIAIEGDVETVLALRNAIDDADVGVLRELVATAGEFAAPIDRAARDIAAAMRRVVGGVASQPRGNGL